MPEPHCRERCFCEACGCTWRDRAVLFGVLHGLESVGGPVRSRERDGSVRGLGISDSSSVSSALSSAFDYVNTDFRRFPRFDVHNVPDDMSGQYNFVTCSDVFEHILPPVDHGLSGVRQLLALRGFAVISVPVDYQSFVEHYPGIVEWTPALSGITWLDECGTKHTDPHPTFHGGSGATLEMRQWTAASFESELSTAGFSRIERLPALPTLGIPSIPDMGCWLAYR